MNFWPRYVGDIQRKTGHLSCAEMGVYDRFLDHIYATEQPLPGDLEACCRIARAMDKSERKAVESVLRQFFSLEGGQYTNCRAAEEIAKAQPKIEAARTNGARGGRPKKNPEEAQEKPTGFPAGTHDEPNSKALQNQSSSSLRSEEGRAKAPPRPNEVSAQVWTDWLTLRKQKRAPVTLTVIEGAKTEASKAGMSLEDFLRVWCRRGSQGLEAAWLKPEERGLKTARQAEVAKWLGPLAQQSKQGEIIDMEDGHGPRIAMG